VSWSPGGTGYIAGWCIAGLLQRGYRVRTTIRSSARQQQVLDAVRTVADPAGRVEFAIADLTDDAGWDDAVTGTDYVLHIARALPRTPRRA
jgi:dihydroflavonol-4-reductase